jgi:DNA-directed RNA polymerase subunit N
MTIFPVRCLSCGKPFCDLRKEYILLKRKQKDHGGEDYLSNQEIFKKLGLRRYCCRNIFISHKEIIDSQLLYVKKKDINWEISHLLYGLTLDVEDI